MKAKELPPQDYLCRRLSYDAETGRLVWLSRPAADFPSARIWNSWNARHAGRQAFTAITANGYATGRLDDGQYLAHRIIWKMVYGADPIEPDHIDGDRANNRLANLRDGTRSTNMKNARKRADNTSGIGNVQDRGGKWVIRFSDSYYGSFSDFGCAVAAREEAAHRLGYSARHGK